EQFAAWSAARRSGTKTGFLEKTAIRVGNHFFAEQRAKADRQLSEELLHSPEFAFVAASWLDTDNRMKGTFDTWPHLEKALAAHLRGPDPESLRKAISLTTKEGFPT